MYRFGGYTLYLLYFTTLYLLLCRLPQFLDSGFLFSIEKSWKSAGGIFPPRDFYEFYSIIASPTPERSPSPFSLAFRRARNTNVIRPFISMATLSTNSFSTASKRSRSQQSSPAPLESPPVLKATKTDISENVKNIPAFLRQSKAGQ